MKTVFDTVQLLNDQLLYGTLRKGGIKDEGNVANAQDSLICVC
jgi:hypothetical protein